jgi:molecular chaperone DnaK (HSP70)
METLRERRIIAIDLGTSNSGVAYWDGIRPQVIRNRFSEPTTPSVVWFDRRRARMVVGKLARDKLGHPREQAVAAVKRKMGSDEPIYLGDQAYLPHDVSGIILAALKEEAENFLKEPVTQAVITVPAYFQAPAVEATKQAGEQAGLQVLALPEEPTAAALAYYHQYRETGDRNWLIYDSGAGTTDISAVALRDGDFKVRGTAGDNYLAGTDFDRRLADLVLRKAGVLLDEKREEHKLARIRLTREAEFAKITLSAETVAYVFIEHLCDDASGDPITIDVEVTRREFEDLIRQDVEDSVDYCREALQKAEMTLDDIDDIILVGGTSHIPLIDQVLEEQLGKKPRKDIDPLTCVVEGAAIVAGLQAVTVQGEAIEIEFHGLRTLTNQTSQDLVGRIRAQSGAPTSLNGMQVTIRRADGGFDDQTVLDDRGGFDFELPLVADATNLFTVVVEDSQGQELGRKELRIEHQAGAPETHDIEYRAPYAISVGLEGGRIAVMIPENSPLPKQETRTFRTVEDDQQELRVPVYEGAHPVADRNRRIGEVVVPDIPPGYEKGSPVHVTIDVDTDRLLHVKVMHVTGRSISAELRPGWPMTPSWEELAAEKEQLAQDLEQKVRSFGTEDQARRMGDLMEGFNEAGDAGERGKAVDRLEKLRKLDDELSKRLPDPEQVEGFNALRDGLLQMAWNQPNLVPNMLKRVQEISTEADQALRRGDRDGFEAAHSKLRAIQEEVQGRVTQAMTPEQRFQMMRQYLDHAAGPEAVRHAEMLAERGRPQYLQQVQEQVNKAQQAIRTDNMQGLGFALQELMGLIEQMKEILLKMGAITD